MRSPYRVLSILFVLTLPAVSASGQIAFGVQGGYSGDTFSRHGARDGAYLLGGQARFGLEALPLILNPSFDYFFNDVRGVQTVQFDFNVLLPLARRRNAFVPYVGAGVAVTRVSLDGPPLPPIERAETNRGLNLLGGAVMGRGPVRLFAQARYTRGRHRLYLHTDRRRGTGLAFSGGLLLRVVRRW